MDYPECTIIHLVTTPLHFPTGGKQHNVRVVFLGFHFILIVFSYFLIFHPLIDPPSLQAPACEV